MQRYLQTLLWLFSKREGVSLQYLHDVTEAGDNEGGGCGFLVLRVAIEEQGIKTCCHRPHDIRLQIVTDHEGGGALGARPLKGIVEE